MDYEQINQILTLLYTIQEACPELYTSVDSPDISLFRRLCKDINTGLTQILNIIEEDSTVGSNKLRPACQSILASLQRIEAYCTTDKTTCQHKIEFELLPLLQEAYLNYYFFGYLTNHSVHLPKYYETEQKMLCGNSYIDEALKRGQYKYEASIIVLAYNKLDYTKMCVESILANIPEGLNYELILVNHGSNDGTKEYFESIHPSKQFDIAVNGGGVGAISRIVEGEFTFLISNDVIVTPHAIENLLTCIRSDSKIAWVVPATPNISNYQMIPASYSSQEELENFANRNNKSDPFRWEQRVRLCNPIDVRRSSIFFSSNGLCLNGAYHTLHPVYATSFPDDRTSLLLRRSDYKMILAKDAYCHHFGSITLKDEIKQQNENKYYLEGRQEFYNAFKIDPWGTGSCFEIFLSEQIVGEEHGHIDILGLNCGLGSNSLKIKEQIKEYCHNLDVKLYNITSNPRYIRDLKGISDEALIIQNRKIFQMFLTGKVFSYVVWEEVFLPDISASALIRSLQDTLCPGGQLIVKKTAQTENQLTAEKCWRELGNSWYNWQKDKRG